LKELTPRAPKTFPRFAIYPPVTAAQIDFAPKIQVPIVRPLHLQLQR
jgi:hypothetical protein